jgi:putative SOS response-associated peptidase YedK
MSATSIGSIAGIWRDGAAGEPPDFTMLTTAPGPDVVPYHNRQVAVLPPADWPVWINLTRPERDILQPFAEQGLG